MSSTSMKIIDNTANTVVCRINSPLTTFDHCSTTHSLLEFQTMELTFYVELMAVDFNLQDTAFKEARIFMRCLWW